MLPEGLGIDPVLLTGEDDPQVLEAARAHGYASVVLPARVVDGCRADAWRTALGNAGVGVLALDAVGELTPYLDGSLSDKVERRRRVVVRRLCGVLEAMPAIGARWLVVGPGRLAENYQTRQEARATYLDSLRTLTAACPTGVGVLAAAVPFRALSGAADVAALVSEVNSRHLAAALDVGHTLLAGEQPGAAAAMLGSALRLLLLNDADLTPGRPRLDQHLVLGGGSLGAAEAEWLRGLQVDRALNISARDGEEPWTVAEAALRWWAKG